MSEVMRGPMNHLSGRRQGRNPLRHPVPQMQPLLPNLTIPPGMFNTQDCRLDQASGDICAAMADPYIVSHIVTGVHWAGAWTSQPGVGGSRAGSNQRSDRR